MTGFEWQVGWSNVPSSRRTCPLDGLPHDGVRCRTSRTPDVPAKVAVTVPAPGHCPSPGIVTCSGGGSTACCRPGVTTCWQSTQNRTELSSIEKADADKPLPERFRRRWARGRVLWSWCGLPSCRRTLRQPGVKKSGCSATRFPVKPDDHFCDMTKRRGRFGRGWCQSALWTAVLLLAAVGTAAAGDGFCDPLLCLCDARAANCSYRGFLALPTGLPAKLLTLDLSNNDVVSVNATELELYPSLDTLNLSRNKISSLFSGPNYKLTSLDLSYNRISSLSRNLQLFNFHAVKYLDLSYNFITTLPPASFPNGKSLEFLSLVHNDIELLETNCFDDLTQLEELRLSRNRISSFPKTVFKRMTQLKILELNRNKLVEIPGLTFHGLENVKILKLKRNSIKYLMDGAFYGLDSMEQLYLERNQVRTVSKGWLYGLNKLKQLSLSYNKVDYIEDDGWDFCRELWQLELRGNELKIVEREILRKLPALTHLDLRDNLISHIDADGAFTELGKLEILQLDGNQLSHTVEDTPETFKGLKLLKRLSLSRNAIKSVGRHALTGLASLEHLDLADNVISTIQDNPFDETPLLSQLSINSTSLLCDCNIRWFPEWVNRSGGVVEGVTATCAHPEHLRGQLVTLIAAELFTCDDSPKPFLLVEPKTQIALRGRDLTLSCSAASTSSESMSFTWKKDSNVLSLPLCLQDVEGAAALPPNDPPWGPEGNCLTNISHKFDGKGMEITSELRLKNLTHTDIGDYQCVVENRYGATYSAKAKITVYVFPRFILTPSDITVQGGASATLKCSATGVPNPSISWQKDSGSDFPAARERRIHVDPDTNTYVINNVKAADMGVYTCTASNLAGSITTNITLNVLESPRFLKPMQDRKVKIGETAVLECISSGSPKPRLKWRKNKGPLYATERHFFTADNQLLIIVKVELGDAGQYECEMINELGSVKQASFLSVDGGVAAASDPTTGIIVIAVVCCVLGTSLVWVFIIYHTRRRAARREWEVESKLERQAANRHNGGESGLPLISEETLLQPEIHKHPAADDDSSERDSGTGDSKRSYDNMEHVVDTVIHNFLAARGEGWSISPPPPSVSDLDTGISSGSGGRHHLEGASSRCSVAAAAPPRPTELALRAVNLPTHAGHCCRHGPASSTVSIRSHASSACSSVRGSCGGGAASCTLPSGRSLSPHQPTASISLAVENPLYDSLPSAQTCDNNNADRLATTASHSPTASLISDSVAYCGRFPAADRRQCPQCGEPLASCPHRDLEEIEVASVSSAGLSSSGGPPSTAASSEQQAAAAALSFHTFHPRRGPSNHDRWGGSREQMSGSRTGDLLSPTTATAVRRKRLSAIELPTGETLLAIESGQEAVGCGTPCPALDPVTQAKEYRGGGTLPRHGLEQEWLEASLNCSDTGLLSESRSSLSRITKERASKVSLFSRSSKRDKQRRSGHQPMVEIGGRRYHSLGRRDLRRERRQSGGGEITAREDRWRPDPAEQTSVATKSNDMFS